MELNEWSNRISAGAPTFNGDGAHLTHRRFTRVETPLGDMLLAVADEGVYGVYFDGQKHQPDAAWFGREMRGADLGADLLLTDAAAQVAAWFARERDDFDLPLAPLGTPFQRSVWEQLVAIPVGTTTTYGAISAALNPDGVAAPGQAQGVGQAVGHNPISVIVPCHRVIGASGSLTGFAGGLERKRWLLAREESDETRETRLF